MFTGIVAWAAVANRVLDLIGTILMNNDAEEQGLGATPPVRCEQCGETPWVVRWGSIRIAQELDGFVYQATSGPNPLLLCRKCWLSSIGMAEPDTRPVDGRKDG